MQWNILPRPPGWKLDGPHTGHKEKLWLGAPEGSKKPKCHLSYCPTCKAVLTVYIKKKHPVPKHWEGKFLNRDSCFALLIEFFFSPAAGWVAAKKNIKVALLKSCPLRSAPPALWPETVGVNIQAPAFARDWSVRTYTLTDNILCTLFSLPWYLPHSPPEIREVLALGAMHTLNLVKIILRLRFKKGGCPSWVMIFRTISTQRTALPCLHPKWLAWVQASF